MQRILPFFAFSMLAFLAGSERSSAIEGFCRKKNGEVLSAGPAEALPAYRQRPLLT
jgi:hypothetical protein